MKNFKVLIPFFLILFALSIIVWVFTSSVSANRERSFDKIEKSIPQEAFSEPAKLITRTGEKKIENFGQVEKEEKNYIEGEVVVKYKKNKINLETISGELSAESFARSKSIERKEDLKGLNASLFKIKDGKTVEEKIEELRDNPNIEYAEPNYKYHLFLTIPNDTFFENLWGLHNTGQTINGKTGTPDADIDAPEAWDLESASQNDVTVAIIDTGVTYNHPDLIDNLVPGHDFVDNDDYPNDYHSHGTHLAGIIAGVSDNSTGVLGMSYKNNLKVMPIKVDLSELQIAQAILYAEAQGAKVINASWGGPDYSNLIHDAIQNVFKGLFVTAAGNYGANNDTTNYPLAPIYPCAYDLDNIICVAATDQNDNLTSWSNYGPISVDVGAPGENIYSTYPVNEDFTNAVRPTFEGTIFTKTSGGWFTTIYQDAEAAPSYENYAHEILTLTSPINTSNYYPDDVILKFSLLADIEYQAQCSYDYLAIEVDNNDNNWVEMARGCGSFFWEWLFGEQISINLGLGSPNMRIRFVWHTNSSVVGEQVPVIDNIVILSSHSYGYLAGTSMSAPHVAGLAGMLFSYHPGLTAAEVKEIILNTGNSLNSLSGKTVSGERINMYNALNLLSNPVIGYTEDNVIPAGQISQTTDGSGVITINFRIKDTVAGLTSTLSNFEYSGDGGGTWNPPANGDNSEALSSDWQDNNYLTATDWSGPVYSFTFNTKHVDVSGLANLDQDDVRIRFKVNNGAKTSDFGTSENFTVDNKKPTFDSVAGISGQPNLTLTFSEPVYASTGTAGVLELSDFTYVDNPSATKTATSLTHTAGSITATMGLSGNLTEGDLTSGDDQDTVEMKVNSVYDAFGNVADGATLYASTGIISFNIAATDNNPANYINNISKSAVKVVINTSPLSEGDILTVKFSDGTNTYEFVSGEAQGGETKVIFDGGESTPEELHSPLIDLTAGSPIITDGAYDNSGDRIFQAKKNEDPYINGTTFILDTISPDAPTHSSHLSGDVDSNNKINAAESPNVSLEVSAEASSTVELYVGGAASSITHTATSGTTTFTNIDFTDAEITGLHPTVPDYSSPKTISFKAKDVAWNLSSASVAINLTKDTIAPNAPTHPSHLGGDSNSDDIINAAESPNVNLEVTAEASSAVELYIDGIASSITYTATSGITTFTNTDFVNAEITGLHPTVPDYSSPKTISFKAKDVAGNTGTSSATINLTKDTQAPNPPTHSPHLSGDADSNNKINATESPNISLEVSAEASSTVELYIDGAASSITHTATSGTTTFTNIDFTDAGITGLHPTVPDYSSPKTISFKATDVAGNKGNTSTTIEVIKDTIVPALVSVLGLVGQPNLDLTFSGPVYANYNGTGNLTTEDFTYIDGGGVKTISSLTHIAGNATATMGLSGVLETGDLTVGDNQDSVAAKTDSVFDTFGNPAETNPVKATTGIISFNIAATDNNPANYINNISKSAVKVVINTSPLSEGDILTVKFSDGTNTYEFVSGEAQGGETKVIFDGGASTAAEVHCPLIDLAEGGPIIADGTYDNSGDKIFQAKKNEDSYFNGTTFILDTLAPNAPTHSSHLFGDADSNNKINAAESPNVSLEVTAEASSTVELYVNEAASSITHLTNENGTTTFTNTDFVNAEITGLHPTIPDYSSPKAISFKATDVARNLSGASSGLSLTKDTVAPSLFSISWNDLDATNDITPNDKLIFTFSETINTLTIPADELDTVLPSSQEGHGYGSNPSINWSKNILTVTLGTGANLEKNVDTINPTDSVVDLAGNPDNSIDIILPEKDTVKPNTPTINAVTTPTYESSQTISGTKDAYTSIWLNGFKIIDLNSNTTWSYKMSLSIGTNSISITAKDLALNESEAATASITRKQTVSGGGGGGGGSYDTLAPSISNIEVIVSSTTTTITWKTNESSISWICYGTTTDYGKELKTTSYTTSHSVTLSDLSSDTTYHYQIKSRDRSGNMGTGVDKTFTTLALGEVPEEEKISEEKEVPEEEVIEKPISEMTIKELKAKITMITALIAQFQAQLAELLGEVAYKGIPDGFSFERNLSYGETSNDVKYLQIILKEEIGPPTYPEDVPATGWFGPITKTSVIEFQEKHAEDILAPWGLTAGTGFIGETTRAKLNEICKIF